jgi:hypothetical protein
LCFKATTYARKAPGDQAESLYGRGKVKVNSKPVALEGFIRKENSNSQASNCNIQ